MELWDFLGYLGKVVFVSFLLAVSLLVVQAIWLKLVRGFLLTNGHFNVSIFGQKKVSRTYVCSRHYKDYWHHPYIESLPLGRHKFIGWLRLCEACTDYNYWEVFSRCSVYVFIVGTEKICYFQVDEPEFQHYSFVDVKPGVQNG